MTTYRCTVCGMVGQFPANPFPTPQEEAELAKLETKGVKWVQSGTDAVAANSAAPQKLQETGAAAMQANGEGQRWEVVPNSEGDNWGIRREGESYGKSIAQMLWEEDAKYIVALHNSRVHAAREPGPASSESLREALERLPFWRLTESTEDGMHTVGYMGAGEFVRRDAVLALASAPSPVQPMPEDAQALYDALDKIQQFARGNGDVCEVIVRVATNAMKVFDAAQLEHASNPEAKP